MRTRGEIQGILLGLKARFQYFQIDDATELVWWQDFRHESLKDLQAAAHHLTEMEITGAPNAALFSQALDAIRARRMLTAPTDSRPPATRQQYPGMETYEVKRFVEKNKGGRIVKEEETRRYLRANHPLFAEIAKQRIAEGYCVVADEPDAQGRICWAWRKKEDCVRVAGFVTLKGVRLPRYQLKEYTAVEPGSGEASAMVDSRLPGSRQTEKRRVWVKE